MAPLTTTAIGHLVEQQIRHARGPVPERHLVDHLERAAGAWPDRTRQAIRVCVALGRFERTTVDGLPALDLRGADWSAAA